VATSVRATDNSILTSDDSDSSSDKDKKKKGCGGSAIAGQLGQGGQAVIFSGRGSGCS